MRSAIAAGSGRSRISLPCSADERAHSKAAAFECLDTPSPPRDIRFTDRAHPETAPTFEATMAHELPKLPDAPDALEAAIDKMTMEIHHGKHHNAYVTNLNKALESAADVAGWSLEDVCKNIAKVPEGIRNAVRNNGGGHWNHSMFWTWM